jgi:hypothetical protein
MRRGFLARGNLTRFRTSLALLMGLLISRQQTEFLEKGTTLAQPPELQVEVDTTASLSTHHKLLGHRWKLAAGTPPSTHASTSD